MVWLLACSWLLFIVDTLKVLEEKQKNWRKREDLLMFQTLATFQGFLSIIMTIIYFFT